NRQGQAHGRSHCRDVIFGLSSPLGTSLHSLPDESKMTYGSQPAWPTAPVAHAQWHSLPFQRCGYRFPNQAPAGEWPSLSKHSLEDLFDFGNRADDDVMRFDIESFSVVFGDEYSLESQLFGFGNPLLD